MGSLTVAPIKALTEPGRYVDGEGLMLRVATGGFKQWILRVRIDGERRDMGVGSLKVLTLAEARAKAAELRREIARGVDPIAERKKVENYAFPVLGDRPVDKIEGPIIRDVLAPISLSKPETARRVRQRIGAVLDWSHVNGYRKSEAPMRSPSGSRLHSA